MAHGFWSGAIRFGLVNIPVSLRPASETVDLDFDLVDVRDFAPVGYKKYNKTTGRDVPRNKIVKTYKVDEGEAVVVTEEDFARALATQMAREHPDGFTATMSKAARRGRLFIDWLRNGRGQTAVAPYSTRARPNAPLAMPISWEDLAHIDRADPFTLRTFAAREAGDPWKGYFKLRQKLPKSVRG